MTIAARRDVECKVRRGLFLQVCLVDGLELEGVETELPEDATVARAHLSAFHLACDGGYSPA